MRTTSILSTVVLGLLYANGALAAPAKVRSADASGSITASSSTPTGGAKGGNSTSSGGGALPAPRYVIYNDQGPDPAPDVKEIEGFNVLALAFLLSTGKGGDIAGAWEKLDASKRQSLKKTYQDAGIKIIVSAFGETEKPTTQGKDPKQLAQTMAKWVKDNGVDGIDVDYEDFDAINGKGVDWLVTFTKTLRQELPQGQYIITHAPVAPWFSKSNGPYLKVDKQVGDLIDWYNLQFYNQGSNVYTTCDNLITKSSEQNPALLEIAANGVPMDKLVVGKPGASKDATNGYMDPATLGKCLAQAKQKGWNAGAMSWEYPTANAQWIKSVISGSGLGGGSKGGNGGKGGDEGKGDNGDNGKSGSESFSGKGHHSKTKSGEATATHTHSGQGSKPTDPQ